MANGVPVIASERGAPKEIIDDGITGYLVNPEHNCQIADVIVRLLSDATLRKEVGEKGRQKVLQNYNVLSYSRSIEKIYREVLILGR